MWAQASEGFRDRIGRWRVREPSWPPVSVNRHIIKGAIRLTRDQARSAIGTVFPTSLTSSTEGPWQNGPQPPSLSREDSRCGRGWSGAVRQPLDKHPLQWHTSPLLQGQGAEKPSSSGARTSSCISAKGMEGKPTSASQPFGRGVLHVQGSDTWCLVLLNISRR